MQEGRVPLNVWEDVEREYRAGQMSVSKIAGMYGLEPWDITRRAHRDGWERAAYVEIDSRIKQKLAFGDKEATDEAIELAAERGAQVIREHRMRLMHARETAVKMVEELRALNDNKDKIEESLVRLMGRVPRDDRAQVKQAMRALTLAPRTSILKDLSTIFRYLIPLERQAFGLKDDATPPGVKIIITEEDADL